MSDLCSKIWTFIARRNEKKTDCSCPCYILQQSTDSKGWEMLLLPNCG